MKTIQITMDEKLLAELDKNEETQRHGRSAVLRLAAAEYLQKQHRKAVELGYRNAYKKGRGIEEEFPGWENEGKWPNE